MPEVTDRTLTRRELNRALLARQHLLDAADSALPEALDRIGGLQAQYAPAMYLGLWSRLAGFTRPDLTAALVDRTVVQGTLLRSTIHLVSATDYWPTALAVRESRRTLWLRTRRGEVSAADMERAADRLRAALAAGPLRRAEVDALLGAGLRAGIGLWVDLVRVPPSGTWERRAADLFGLAEDWLGPPTGTVADGVDLLVRRYLTGFGPAARADIASWAGLPVRTVTAALSRWDTVTYRAEDGTVLVDLPGLPLPDGDTPAPVRFLPTWDATLLVHARRTQILPERHRSKVFSVRMPHSVNTFLVDGSVAGTWRFDGGEVTLAEFDPLPASVLRGVRSAAARLAAFHS